MKLNPFRWFRNAGETYSIGDDAVLQAFYGAMSSLSASGIRVNRETALRSTAVLACLIVRSETHSALPVDVLRAAGRYRIDAADEVPNAYRVLAVAPNDLMTSGEFWRWVDQRQDLHGNAYARIVWRGFEAVELWPLIGASPRFVWDRVRRLGVYEYGGDDFTPANVYPVRDVLHFKGAVLKSPTEGRSLVDLAAEAIGVSIGSEQFFARLLSNGSHFPGWLEADQVLPRDFLDRVQEELKGYAGVIRAGIVRIFHGGLKYHTNPMSIKDADLTAQMRWQLQQICSVMRVPLPMVQELSYNTYTNSEQADLWLAKHTVTPMCINLERVVRHKLFPQAPTTYMRFNMAGLLRGDYKTRMEGYSAGINSGFLTRNEARGWEDLNPRAGLDLPTLNLGYGTVDNEGLVHPAVPSESPSAPAAMALAPLVRDAGGCIRRRYLADQRAGRSPEDTEVFAAEKLAPLIEAHVRAGLDFDADTFIAQAIAGQPEEVLA